MRLSRDVTDDVAMDTNWPPVGLSPRPFHGLLHPEALSLSLTDWLEYCYTRMCLLHLLSQLLQSAGSIVKLNPSPLSLSVSLSLFLSLYLSFSLSSPADRSFCSSVVYIWLFLYRRYVLCFCTNPSLPTRPRHPPVKVSSREETLGCWHCFVILWYFSSLEPSRKFQQMLNHFLVLSLYALLVNYNYTVYRGFSLVFYCFPKANKYCYYYFYSLLTLASCLLPKC